MPFKTASYRTATCCYGTNCYAFYDNKETDPCWGVVGVVEEEQWGEDDYSWIHACEGHARCWQGDKYIQEPV